MLPEVEVTQEDIDKGQMFEDGSTKRRSATCPVALAVKRVLPECDFTVYRWAISKEYRRIARFPNEVGDFIRRADYESGVFHKSSENPESQLKPFKFPLLPPNES